MTNPLFRKSKEKTLKIGLFGLGKSNLGVLGYLKEKNLNFELTLRSDKNISTDIFCHRSFIGSGALSDIDEDVIFLSPSVRRDRAELIIAEKRGTLLFSDSDIRLTRVAAEHSEELIGTGELLQYADRFRCGGREFMEDEIGNMALVQAHLLLLSYRGEYFELRSDSGANLRKYFELWKG